MRQENHNVQNYRNNNPQTKSAIYQMYSSGQQRPQEGHSFPTSKFNTKHISEHPSTNSFAHLRNEISNLRQEFSKLVQKDVIIPAE
jgi:hypothetical protein